MNSPNFLSIETLKGTPHFLDGVTICDIRTPQEFAREHIPSSINVPMDQLKSFDFSKFREKNMLFLCHSGMRTRNAMHIISAKNFSQAACLEGGLEKWKEAGLPVEKNTNIPIDIMRQVQIIAGSMILIGLLGFAFISKYFLLLPLVVSIGQIIAGLTGFCGMAKLLARLPFNKFSVASSTCAKN